MALFHRITFVSVCFLMVFASVPVLSQDSPAPIVWTEKEVHLQKGTSATLSCRWDREVQTITWTKGSSGQEILVISDFYNDVGQKTGPGYKNGLYDIDDNLSLIIKNVGVENNDRYRCEIIDPDFGTPFQNETDVLVFAPPLEPFPIIEECRNDFGGQTTKQNCRLEVTSNSSITCSVSGYYPSISLKFRQNSTKAIAIETLESSEVTNSDGTFNKSVTVAAMPDGAAYICVASGIPGAEAGMERVSSIILYAPQVESTTATPMEVTSQGIKEDNNTLIIIVAVVIICAAAVAVVILIAFFKRRRLARPTDGTIGNAGVTEPLMEGVELVNDKTLKETEIKAFSEGLKVYYRREFQEIKTSPLDPQSYKRLEQIYVNLLLLSGYMDEDSENIQYDKLFEIMGNKDKNEKTRLAFLGEAGVGKTTLLSKIAYDWATGKHLQGVELLLFIPLREIGQTEFISDIPNNYVPCEARLDSRKLDGYLRDHQKKVLLLLDGLDEYDGDIKNADPTNAAVGIMRGDELPQAPVAVTTRPWRAEQITSVERIYKRYMRIRVQGFKEGNVSDYVKRFFNRDSDSAESLINLIKGDSLVAKNMSPYPIFCTMLCHMWKEHSRREVIQKLQTFSQLFQEMVDSLIEQWVSKSAGSRDDQSYKKDRKRCTDSMRRIGKIAFNGLLTRQVTFTEKTFQKCKEDMKTGNEIGVLSSEKCMLTKELRRKEMKQAEVQVSFPHKLFQEYLAGLYLASLSNDDRPQFEKYLTDNILLHHEEFRYLLYFTAAQETEGGQDGKTLMEYLCTKIDQEDFVVDVAFECHDETAISPIVDLFQRKTEMKISRDMQQEDKHTWAGYRFIWATCGHSSKTAPDILTNSNDRRLDPASHDAAVGLFTLPSLRSLELHDVEFNGSFYQGMVTAAPHSKIENLTLRDLDLDPEASIKVAKGVFQMPKLKSLELHNVTVDDAFFSVMSELAAGSQIETMVLPSLQLDGAASKHCAASVFSLPMLRSLQLHRVELNNDEFFKVMTELAPKSQIQSLKFRWLTLSKRRLGTIISLPALQNITLHDVTSHVPEEILEDQSQPKVNASSSLVELNVDEESLPVLCELDLGKTAPKIQKIVLMCARDVRSDVIKTHILTFAHLTEFQIEGHTPWSTISDTKVFCQAMASSCPRLTALSLVDLKLGNEKVIEVIQALKGHSSLRDILISQCDTDQRIEGRKEAIKGEGKVIRFKHGQHGTS